MNESPEAKRETSGRGERILHVVTLSCLAFAHPLLDLIGRTPEFLAIRRIDTSELAVMLGLLLLLIPSPFAVVALAGDAAGRRAGRIGAAIAIGLLAVPIALRLESASGMLDGVTAVAIAAVAGAGAAWLYHRKAGIRSFVTWLSPALVVVPILFVAQPGVRRAVAPPAESRGAAASGASAPVFMVILDELSFNAIVDDAGLVDAARYPNLAALARRSTWYRNAWTVADTTNVSIPAMLTGKFPRAGALPLLSDYPVNLFTILGGDYTIRADEPITRLCPPNANSYAPATSHENVGRFTTLGVDLSVVWLHLVLPPQYRRNLPSISMSWEGFLTHEDGSPSGRGEPAPPATASELYAIAVEKLTQGNRPERFREFLGTIDAEDSKALYFTHVMLPHTPWEHFPSGHLYDPNGGRIPGLDGDAWGRDEGLVRLGAARYLLQTEFIDHLVGELVAAVEKADLFDRSLIVIVSDHGVAFHPGDQRRGYTPENAADTVPIPLIVKAPFQKEGTIVDEHVTTLDILPTMLRLLGVVPPHDLAGESAFVAGSGPSPSLRLSTVSSGEVLVDIAALATRRIESARALRTLIGPATDPYRASRSAPRPELLGRRVDSLPLRDGVVRASLFEPDAYRNYDRRAARLPAFVTGALRSEAETPLDLALAIDGTIVATARSVPAGAQVHELAALLPESALESPFKELSIYRVVDLNGEASGGLALERTATGSRRTYRLDRDKNGGVRHLLVDGVPIPLGRKLDGWIESAARKDGSIRVTGWAADVTNRKLAAEVVVFHRDTPVASGGTWVAKGYVAEGLGEPAYVLSGFEFDIAATAVPQLENEGLRAFAISEDGNATELGTMFLRVEQGAGGEEIVRSNGTRIPVRAGAIDGRIEAVELHENGTALRGWSANRARAVPAARIVVTLDGRVVKEEAPSLERPDLAQPGGAAPRCGFLMHFDVKPAEARSALESGRARVLALSGRGEASELRVSRPGR
ncbi:MAG: sulfatase-like hydrolase/transferase [Acidobacteria bacterium]|nr:sulfatase-like hydrolase/transferase [Acidobacteriota bacterium]